MPTSSSYFIWSSKVVPNAATIISVQNIDPQKILAGKYSSQTWPKNAACVVQGPAVLTDNMHGAGFPVVSEKIKKALGRKAMFFPIHILDANHKTISKDYFCMKSPIVLNCVEWKDSNVTWLGKEKASPVTKIKGLALYEPNIGKNPVFTGENISSVVMMQESTVSPLRKLALSGLHLVTPKEFEFSFQEFSTKSGGAKTSGKEQALESEKWKKAVDDLAKKLSKVYKSQSKGLSKSELSDMASDVWNQQGVESLEKRHGKIPAGLKSSIALDFQNCLIKEILK